MSRVAPRPRRQARPLSSPVALLPHPQSAAPAPRHMQVLAAVRTTLFLKEYLNNKIRRRWGTEVEMGMNPRQVGPLRRNPRPSAAASIKPSLTATSAFCPLS